VAHLVKLLLRFREYLASATQRAVDVAETFVGNPMIQTLPKARRSSLRAMASFLEVKF
jgi:hypothetical protein